LQSSGDFTDNCTAGIDLILYLFGSLSKTPGQDEFLLIYAGSYLAKLRYVILILQYYIVMWLRIMTKISRKKLPLERDEQMLNQLWQAVTLLETKDEVRKFLRNILTRTEIKMLSKRLEAIRMLDEGYRYFDIRKQLNMSEVTIAKLSEQYQSFGEGYKLVIDRLWKINHKPGELKRRLVTGQVRQAQQFWVGTAKELTKVYKKGRKRRSARS